MVDPRGQFLLPIAFCAIIHGPVWAKPVRQAAPAALPVATTTLHQAVADAWARLPQRRDFSAQQDVAAANFRSGGAFVPNAPTATGSYVNDQIAGSNYNYKTAQIGVSTPIWLPGEGSATQNAASAQGRSIEAQTAMAHIAVASQVLQLVVNATDAADQRTIAVQRLTTNRSLAYDLGRQFQVGEASQSDALAADAEVSNATVNLAQADAQLGAARVALAELTGSESIPLLVAPTAPPPLTTSDVHPQIAAALRQVEAARAQQQLTQIQNRDDPEIGLQGINEKQPGTRWDTRVGVTMTFHFATEARNAPRRAMAQENVTKAEVQLELARRQVASLIGQARIAVEASEGSTRAADKATGELQKRRGQIERAWRLGEMPFIEVVRANALAFDAEAMRARARTRWAAAAAQLRLASGELP